MDVSVRISVLLKAAQKRPAFWHAVSTAGQVEGDSLRLDKGRFEALCLEHFGALAPGNIVARLVKPIAKAARLEGCGGCAERQVLLNTAMARKI